MPYRQNIPSFGDWGYYLAWVGDITPAMVKQELSVIEGFNVETRFITPELMRASFAFGKGELQSEQACVNTLMQPCLLANYVERSWIVE